MRLDELAARIGAQVEGDGSVEVRGVATLDAAGEGDLTFLSNPRYGAKVGTTRASAVLLPPSYAGPLRVPALRAADTYAALARILAIFHPPAPRRPGIHPTAVIDASAALGESPAVGPYAVIGARTRIGARADIGAHVTIGADTAIGDDFTAHAHASVRERVQIGDRVTLQDGAVVGSDGFGYAIDAAGQAEKMPQAGTVVLEDDVEIGAHSTIDRATVGATRIGRGAKIDNLVHVAHGCDVGEGCFLAAQVGLAGSTRLGRYVQLGGQVGVAGHLEIGDMARVAAKSGVPNDVPRGATVGGYPAVEVTVWRRVSAALPRLPELLRRVRRLEKAAAREGEEDVK